jgi:hypothetical protein
VIVNLLMVVLTHREQIVKIGGSAVPPPDHVVNLAGTQTDVAPWDGTRAVQRMKGAALGTVGNSGVPTQVQRTRRMQHDAVRDDHDVSPPRLDAPAQQRVDDAFGHLDGQAPVHCGTTVTIAQRLRHVDDEESDVVCATSQRQRDERTRAKVVLTFAGVGGRVGRLVVTEHSLHLGLQPFVQRKAGDGIERPCEAPHAAVTIHPTAEPRCASLPGQSRLTTIVATTLDIECLATNNTSEFVGIDGRAVTAPSSSASANAGTAFKVPDRATAWSASRPLQC